MEGGITPYIASLLTPFASRLAYATHRLLHWLNVPCVAFHGEPRAAGARGQRALVRIKRYPCVAFHGEPRAAGARGQRALVRIKRYRCVALYGASRVRPGFGGKAPIKCVALITSMLCMASCGFEPLQGQAYRNTLTADLSAIAVNVSGSSLNNGNTNAVTISRRYGELLKAEIEDSVNPKAAPSIKQFDLTIGFTESDIALFVNPDGTASRGNLDYATSYTLRRIADSKVVASGSIRRVSSYNSSPTADFASYISIEDARRRAMLELAQDYKLRLAALLPTLSDAKASIIEIKPEAPALELQPLRAYEALPSRN